MTSSSDEFREIVREVLEPQIVDKGVRAIDQAFDRSHTDQSRERLPMTTIPPTPLVTIQLNRAAIDALFTADPTCVPKLAASVVDHIAREHISPFISQHPTMVAFRNQYRDAAVKAALEAVGKYTHDRTGERFTFTSDFQKSIQQVANGMLSQLVIDLVAKAIGPDLAATVQTRIDVELSRAISSGLSSKIDDAVKTIMAGKTT